MLEARTERAARVGLIGGFLVDLFLIVIRAVPFPGVYQFIASALVGPVAFTSSAYILLGLVLHFLISIVFAFTYAFVVDRWPAAGRRPIASGAIFGVVVMLVMQVVTGIAHVSQPPSPIGIAIGLISHIVFFGLPVAWYITRAQSRPTLAVS